MYELTEEIKLDKNIKHNIDIVVDRLVVKPEILMRLSSSVENVLDIAEGLLTVDVIGGEELHFSRSFSCPDCGVSIDEIEPRSFSFNNPFGACPVCAGIGYSMEFSEELMIPDPSLSLNEGAIQAPGWASSKDNGSFTHALLEALSKHFKFSLDTPFEELSAKVRDVIVNGTEESVDVRYVGQRGRGVYPTVFEGLIRNEEDDTARPSRRIRNRNTRNT